MARRLPAKLRAFRYTKADAAACRMHRDASKRGKCMAARVRERIRKEK